MNAGDPADDSGGDQQGGDQHGGQPQRSQPDPLAHRRAEPRAFAFFWTCWLLAVTAISIGRLGNLGLSSYEIYRPAARVLLTGVFVGCAIFWPLVRLSQERPGRPIRSFLGDLIVVVAPAAAIIASQSLPGMAGWSMAIAAYLLAYLMAWSLGLVGALALIVNGRGSRWMGMAGCIAVASMGPMFGLVLFDAGASADDINPWLMVSPLTVTYEITRDRFWTGDTAVVLREHMLILAGVWMTALSILVTAAVKSRAVSGLPSVRDTL